MESNDTGSHRRTRLGLSEHEDSLLTECMRLCARLGFNDLEQPPLGETPKEKALSEFYDMYQQLRQLVGDSCVLEDPAMTPTPSQNQDLPGSQTENQPQDDNKDGDESKDGCGDEEYEEMYDEEMGDETQGLDKDQDTRTGALFTGRTLVEKLHRIDKKIYAPNVKGSAALDESGLKLLACIQSPNALNRVVKMLRYNKTIIHFPSPDSLGKECSDMASLIIEIEIWASKTNGHVAILRVFYCRFWQLVKRRYPWVKQNVSQSIIDHLNTGRSKRERKSQQQQIRRWIEKGRKWLALSQGHLGLLMLLPEAGRDEVTGVQAEAGTWMLKKGVLESVGKSCSDAWKVRMCQLGHAVIEALQLPRESWPREIEVLANAGHDFTTLSHEQIMQHLEPWTGSECPCASDRSPLV